MENIYYMLSIYEIKSFKKYSILKFKIMISFENILGVFRKNAGILEVKISGTEFEILYIYVKKSFAINRYKEKIINEIKKLNIKFLNIEQYGLTTKKRTYPKKLRAGTN